MNIPNAIRALCGSTLLAATFWFPTHAAEPLPIKIAAPAYLSLDGRWYVFEPPFALAHTEQVTLLTRPDLPGFFLHGFVSARDCVNAGGAAAQGVGSRFAYGERLVGAFDGQFDLGPDAASGGSPVVDLGFCPGSVVVFLTSAQGNLECANAIEAPYAPGECGLLDALAAEAANVFESSFEQ